MRYGVMSILALGLLMAAPAEAARNDQSALRNQPRPAASAPVAATPPAAPGLGDLMRSIGRLPGM
jgi:hypothetical protein